MSVEKLKTPSRRLRFLSSTPGRVASTAFAGVLAAAILQACAGGGSGGGGTGGLQGSGGAGNGNGTGASTGTGGSLAGTGGTVGPGTGGTRAGSGGSTGATGGTLGTGGSGNGPDASVASGGSTGGGGSMVRDGGASDAPVCPNTDPATINIDSLGRVCNNQWGIQGAWYCYSDPMGRSTNCPSPGTGIIPFNPTSGGMCVSGTTAATNNGAAFGAGIGFEFNNLTVSPTTKGPYNPSSKNIVGFAITVTGDSGGSALNINFPQIPTLFLGHPNAGEAAAVTVPGPSGSSMTYNIPIAQAMVGDNGNPSSGVFPPPAFVPTALTDVQVTIPGADGVAHAYNICVTKVVPLMAMPAAPAALGNYGAVVREGKQIFLELPGSPYAIQNDPFTVGSDLLDLQAMTGNNLVGFSAIPRFQGGGGVRAYPSALVGWVPGGYFVGRGAPGAYTGGKTIGTLTMATSSWAFTPGSGANYDAAYDIWFANGNAAPLNAGFELMVWLNENGVGPIGGAGTAANVGGRAVHVATGTNPTGQPVISYVFDQTTNSVTGLDLLPFFRDAAGGRLSGLSTGSFLLSVHAGFELYGGSTPWVTNSFSANVQ
jgi:hypothetical protein